jgi:hypothetical protein
MANAPSHPAPHADTKETAHQTEAHTAAERKAAEDKAAAERKAAEDKKIADAKKPVSLELLVALLATDWLVGDKAHYAMLRQQTIKLLTQIGEDGAEAKLRLEGFPTSAALLLDVPPDQRRVRMLEGALTDAGGMLPEGYRDIEETAPVAAPHPAPNPTQHPAPRA